MSFKRYLAAERTSHFLIILGVILVVSGAILFLWKSYYLNFSQEIDAAKFGQFGDFIGGVVGTFWGLAGVILFYIALTEQRKDFQINRNALKLQIQALNDQMREFEKQRRELELSRKIYEEQNKTQKIQQFESNFYSLLNVYQTIKHNLDKLSQSNDYFKMLYDELTVTYDEEKGVIHHHERMITKYIELFNIHRGQLSHYFKSFYRIAKIIDSNDYLDDRQKYFYAKILRSQLTEYEQLLLYYNSHSFYGRKGIPLLLEYNFLKHLPIFKKPEFNHYSTKQSGYELILFAERLSNFLIIQINSFNSIFDDFEHENGDRAEEKFEYFDCTVSINLSIDEIELEIICDINISNNRINLSESEFSAFLQCLLTENINLRTYIYPKNVELSSYTKQTDKHKTFGIKIEGGTRLNINHDKY